MTPHLRLAAENELDAAADALAAAFEHYPWTRHVIPDDDYAWRLRELQLVYLRHAHVHGFVALAGPADGVIAVLPPDASEPEPAAVDRIVQLHGDRLGRLGDSEGASPEPGSWRIETVGVLPARQGRGLASELIRFALAEGARRGAGRFALDTSDERNVRLYERHGFTVVSRVDPPDGPPVWGMSAVVADAAPANGRTRA
ncbi:N-acetyltransferase [Microbacterium sp. AG238]|uniref:GNAT family N-acetyltransferase n=1 Tax=Microbacterium sp. AG238 TaxID=2183994 RepID=UPI000E7246BE|nr:GNAT family N-acetyltransferase [Microbacterium sp. AG238]RKE60233.1 acetyltransferase (GNAT) family protein [Microbacterium sp. AG238]